MHKTVKATMAYGTEAEKEAAKILSTHDEIVSISFNQSQSRGCGVDMYATTAEGDKLKVEVKSDQYCFTVSNNLFFEFEQNYSKGKDNYTSEMHTSGIFLNQADVYVVKPAPDVFIALDIHSLLKHLKSSNYPQRTVKQGKNGNHKDKICRGYVVSNVFKTVRGKRVKEISDNFPLWDFVIAININGQWL